eukprot:COSAG05_NODE_189_length_14633_cov_44.869134_2_plen_620_part_00
MFCSATCSGLLYADNQFGACRTEAPTPGSIGASGVWSGGVQTLAQRPVLQNSYLRGLSAADHELAAELAAERAENEERGSNDGSDEDDPDINAEDRHGRHHTQDEPATSHGANLPVPPRQREEDEERQAEAAVVAELQAKVEFWSDFLKAHVHARSLHTLQRTTRFDDFDCYAAGVEAYQSDPTLEIATDACRRFLEECDLLQGFHVLTDADTAWGGVSVKLLEYIRDDYPTTPILTFAGAQRGGFPALAGDYNEVAAASTAPAGVARRKPLNTAVCMAELANHSTLIVPFSSNTAASTLVRFPAQTDYNTSALAATAIETATLSYRLLAERRARLRDITDILCRASAAGGGARPLPLISLAVHPTAGGGGGDGVSTTADGGIVDGSGLSQDRAQAHLAMLETGGHLKTLMPQCASPWVGSSSSSSSRRLATDLRVQPMQVYTLRGLDTWQRSRGGGLVADTAAAVSTLRGECYAFTDLRTRASSQFVGGSLPLPLCFPNIFDDCHVGDDGHVQSEPEPELQSVAVAEPWRRHRRLQQAAVATRLSNTPVDLLPMVRSGNEVVAHTSARPTAIMMAAVGGMSEGGDLIESAAEVLTSMQQELEECFADSDEDGDGDDDG